MRTDIQNEQETAHPAWAAWLANSGHTPGTTMGWSGRAHWQAFRDGWQVASDIARPALIRAETLEETSHGPTSHFHEYRQTLEKLGCALRAILEETENAEINGEVVAYHAATGVGIAKEALTR